MNASIKTKLLVICTLLVLLSTLSISISSYVLMKRDKHHASQQHIQIAFEIIRDDFVTRRNLYQDKLIQFFGQVSNLSWVTFSYHEERRAYFSLMSNLSHFTRAAGEVKGFGQAISADRLLLYGMDKRLLMAYQRNGSQETIGGYVVAASGNDAYLSLDDYQHLSRTILQGKEPIPDNPLPDGLSAEYTGDIPDTVSMAFSRDGLNIALSISMPLLYHERTVGFVVCNVFYTQSMVKRFAALSKTEISFFAGERVSVSTLPLPHAFDLAPSASCEDILLHAAQGDLVSVILDGKPYYQEQCVFRKGETVIGALAVSLSQELEQDAIQKIFNIVGAIMGAGILLNILLISLVVVPRFTGPIIALSQASQQIAMGDLSQDIEQAGRDELGVLARSFAHMRDEIKRKIQELQHLNDELERRVEERTAEVMRQTYILDAFLANVPDAIYFKDREGRFIRSNQAHARLMGFDDPYRLVGKSDFDFYPAEQVQPRYEQEQEILHTGQPLLNFEEPNARGTWTLTTKMPLRDEHGAIIGTFGVSRDITELKKAQQALTQAYSEISVLNTQLQEENVRMGAELDVVKQLQQMILPRPEELRGIPGLDIAGYMQPADEVGGDYYDVLHDDRLLHIGIGDVTGHGLESGVLMLMTQAAVRTLIEHGETDPVKFINTLNRLIYKNAQRIGTDKNLTFALVQYQQGEFKLVGQHEELLVVRQNGQVERVNTMDLGFQVGLVDEISEWVHAATITLQSSEGIVLYTDGITEAENCHKQQYGLDRLCAAISRNWTKPVEAIKQAVVDDVFAHIGKQTMYDDMTLVIVKQK